MLKVLKILLIIVVCALALVGIAFLGFKSYSYWFFVSEKGCVDNIYYSLGTLDDRHGLSEAQYRQVFNAAEAEFETFFGKDIFKYYDGFNVAQNIVTYNVLYNPITQMKINSLASFVEKNDEFNENIQTLRDEHISLKERYEDMNNNYESLVKEYEIFSEKQGEINTGYDSGLVSISEVKSYQDQKSDMLTETKQTRLKVIELGEQTTAKAIELNEYVKEDNLLRASFNEIDQDFTQRALNYVRTSISYNVDILYFNDKEQLKSLILNSFQSIVVNAEQTNLKTELHMKDNTKSHIDQSDLKFTICS